MYAVSALTLAREAGFDVPDDRMAKAVSFLRDGLFRKEGTDGTIRVDQEYACTISLPTRG